MATSNINCGVNDIKDAYGLWFKAGDTISIASTKGSYTGFISSNNNKIARCVIPLTKPVKPGTTVKLYGDFYIRAGSSPVILNVTSTSPLTGTATDCGIAVDITDGSNTLGTADSVCSVGVGGTGMTIVFS